MNDAEFGPAHPAPPVNWLVSEAERLSDRWRVAVTINGVTRSLEGKRVALGVTALAPV